MDTVAAPVTTLATIESILPSAPGLITAALLLIIAAVLWFVCPGPLGRLAQWAERRRGGLTVRRARHDGVSWHWLEGGQGEPLVLLHGFNGDAHHFARAARHLGQHFRLIAPDIPGFGETRLSQPISHRIEDIAQRLLAWLDHQQVDTFYLGGNSMGGYIAMAMAQQAPERVRALWLLAPGGVHQAPLSPVLQEVAEDRHNPLVVRNRQDFEVLLDYCFVQRPWMPGPLIRHLAHRAHRTCEQSLVIFDAMLHDSPPLEQLADGLTTPALIYWGQDDQVLHPQGAAIIEGLMPHAHRIVVSGMGHLPMIESPRASAEAWLAFTEQLARERDGAPA